MIKNKGFTLVELLVVMTIVAILAGLALTSYQGARKNARDGKRKADLEQIRSALEMCYADEGSYPTSIYASVSCGGQTYLSSTPKDPITDAKYSYLPGATFVTYQLCASLEMTGNYCVANP